MNMIATTADLEACMGVAGLPVKMKVIDFIDAGAIAWLAAAPLAFVAYADEVAPVASLAGGAPGFATAKDAKTLVLPRAALDAAPVRVGQGAGVLFLVPGIGETMRINGPVAAITDAGVEIAVEEVFIHCAKALIRSSFWEATPGEAPDDAAAFLSAASFLALATHDGEGRADMSPKGDPAGGLIRLHDDVATLAERPGNRLAYGFHNMVARPMTAAIVLIPGSTKVARVTGKASITTDEAVRAAFIVEGKTPILATRIEDAVIEIAESPALAAARLWPAANHAASGIDPSAVLVAHVKANKSKGLAAMALRTAVNRGTVAKGLAHSYRNNLY